MAVLTQVGGLGCVAPSSKDPPPQLALGMAGGARQGCACLDTPGHTWTHMDTHGHTCILTCPCSPAVPPRPLGTLSSHLAWHRDLAWHPGCAASPLAWHGAHGEQSVPRQSPRPQPGAAHSSWSFNEVNCIKSSVCPKCPSLREAAAAQPGHTPGAGQGATGLGTCSRAGHVAAAGGGGGRRRFSTFAIISLLPPKFTAYLSGLSASNLIKSGKL